MRRFACVLVTCVALGFGLAASPARAASTLATLKSRGYLQCGVVTDYAGFGYLDNQGRNQGFDVDFCRAVAAALGVQVQYSRVDGKTRFPALQSGEVDMAVMMITDAMSRESKLGIDFPALSFYDGQTYLVRKELNVHSVKDLAGAAICVTSGGTGAVNTADYFRAHGLTYKAVVFQRTEESNRAYTEGRCDAIIGQTANLAALRAVLKDPDNHVMVPEMISREPMGPAVSAADRQFSQVVRWVVNGLILAEAKGITQANVEEMAAKSTDAEVRRFLGAEGDLGPDAGLPKDWAVRMVKQVGNYGEIFNRNVGPGTIFKMERGLNALWSNGGLLYPLSFQ